MAGAGKSALSLASKNPTLGSAIGGAALGGLYGGVSSNTSVLGGAMGGAMIGAGAYRYGAKPLAAVNRMQLGKGMGFGGSLATNASAYGSAMGRSLMRDARGSRMMANQGINKMRGIGRGWYNF